MPPEDTDTEIDSSESKPCGNKKIFKLGDYAEVTAVCQYEEHLGTSHIATDILHDNSIVTFRWFG